ncbi:GpE family phage tail protein [Escherichia coli]
MADIATIFHWPPSVTDVMPLCVLNCTGREFLRKTMREQLPV